MNYGKPLVSTIIKAAIGLGIGSFIIGFVLGAVIF